MTKTLNQLNEATTLADDDLLLARDTSAVEDKRITLANLKQTAGINQRTIYVGSVAELESLTGSISGQEALVSGCSFKYDGTAWVATGPVTPEAYGAAGDGVTPDDSAFAALYASGVKKVVGKPGSVYYLTSEIEITSDDVVSDFSGSEIKSELGYVLPSTEIFATAGVFYTNSTDKNDTKKGIKFYNVTVTGIGATAPDTFIFLSKSAISDFVYGRVDDFEMSGCVANNLKLCGTYGKDCKIHSNSGRLTSLFTQESDRNIAILFNQLVTDAVDVSTLDLEPSNCQIYGNQCYYYGGGVAVHTYFNNADPARRPIKGSVVSGNTIIGRTIAEATTLGDATKRGQVGIYCASIEDVLVTGNTVENHADMAVDLEFTKNANVTGNSLKNGGVAMLWETDDIVISGNKMLLTEPDTSYIGFIKGVSGNEKRNIVVNYNSFYSESVSGLIGNVSCQNTSDNFKITNNDFKNSKVFFGSGISHKNTVVSDNTFSFDVDAGETSIILVYNNLNTKVSNNKIESSVAQSATLPAIDMVMARISGVDPEYGQVLANTITGFSASIKISVAGSLFGFWVASVIDNIYTGTFDNSEQTRIDNFTFFHGNKGLDVSGNKYTAPHPGAIPTTGSWQRGSEIRLFDAVPTTLASGSPTRYVCSNYGTGGSSWVSVEDY